MRNRRILSTTCSPQQQLVARNGRLKSRGKFWKAWSLFGVRWSAIIRRTREHYLVAERYGSARAESLIARVTVEEQRVSRQGRRRRGGSDHREGMKRRGGEEGDKMWRSWTARHGAAPSRRVYWSQGAERFNLPLATVPRHAAIRNSGLARRPRWCPWTPVKSSRPPHASPATDPPRRPKLFSLPVRQTIASLAEVDRIGSQRIETYDARILRHRRYIM